MNKQSLDERIDTILLERYGNSITHADCDESCMEKSNYIELKKELCQAFKDVIQEVLPEKGYATAWTRTGDGKYETEFLKGRNQTIDTINSNVKELGL